MGNITFVGLDVHKATIAVSVAEGGRDGEVRQLGRETEAKAAAEEYLKRAPDFSQVSHLEMLPFLHAEDREHYAAGLRKAGLSE
jgi:hypothetical protein